MMKQRSARTIAQSILALAAALTAAHAVQPLTDKVPVTDEYHGVKVVDDYRWLEEAGTPAVKAWTAGENQHTRAYLDSLPELPAIRAQLTAWYAQVSASWGGLIARPGRLFATKFQPPKQQRLLVALTGANDIASEKVVVDPNELAPKGQVAMDWFVPSPDGSVVAVCLSENGSEEGALHFYRTETGEALPDVIARVQYPTAGGSAAWAPDGKSIYYTRFPRAGEKAEADLNFYQQIYVHDLGTKDTADRYSAGKDFPRIAEIELATSRSGRWLIADVSNGDGGEHAHYVRDLETGSHAVWRQVTKFEDGIKQAQLGADDATLFLRSVKDAPRGKIVRLPLDGTVDLKDAALIVPASDAVIEDFVDAASFLYVSDLVGGPSRLRRFGLDGKDGRELAVAANSAVDRVLALVDQPNDNRILFHKTSFTEPGAWFSYDPVHDADGAQKTALANTSPVDFSDIEVVREFATSKDGTKVPVNILHRKGAALDGSHPTILSGYGGYGLSLRPHFDFTSRLWFDRGGVIATANLRGGGEYGEEWHTAGNLTHKQNVFDDFAACAEHLIARRYTDSAHLAVEGGSNGGLLMGALLTQHPELARAVVSHVGIYDMLRVELDPNGAFNVTEFGTVKDSAQFEAIYAYSPYHHVVDGTKYPAVFLLAGEQDGRVNPANSRKMAARLQAATSSGLPVLVRLSSDSGHGMGTALTETIAQEADVFAFLFDQLGVPPLAAPAKEAK